MTEISIEELNNLLDKLHTERKLDFRGYKASSLIRRIQRRMDLTKCADVQSYERLLDSDSSEYDKLLDSILINVTEFFREPDAWQVIQNEVIPKIADAKGQGDTIRVWSAGCATGEEAYTIAMAFSEALGERLKDFDTNIIATDMDESALAAARKAEYPDDSLKALPEETIRKFFEKTNGMWRVRPEIREMVSFARHNMVADEPVSETDLVVCRNVLIYMTAELQNQVLMRFHQSLATGAYLFLGKAESLLTVSRMFRPVNERWRIFRKEETPPAQGTVREQWLRSRM